ncbi:MAG TPA: hypothetical protein VFK12_09620 [Gammaproteobacteria bacterium]|nr:hypothetical protein [Gammaproteobacteria bacterium]
MNIPTSSQRDKDMLRSGWRTWLIWGIPWTLIVVAQFAGNTVHTALWVSGFGATGIICMVNARRCGRRHCLYTGPLYLISALASLLYGLQLLPLGIDGWEWIMYFALAGTILFCCVVENVFGKYISIR